MARTIIPAFAYIRTSSAANVGPDKDSAVRQRAAIDAFAKRNGYRIVEYVYDDAVSGGDAVHVRPGFAAMVRKIAGDGVRSVLVETASRFSRDLMVQETGHVQLRKLGVDLIAADSPEAFVDDGPTATMVRQILGSVSQFEKAVLVAKLKGARQRVRVARGRCEGRKPLAVTVPATVALARKLARRKPKGKALSLRAVAAALAARGHVNEQGRVYAAKSVCAMLRGPN